MSLKISHAAGDALAVVTGIAGEDPRYHPIWLMGKPPKSPQGGA